MDKGKIKTEKKIRRKARIRARVSGTSERPRLCVFKSNKNIYLQMVDDINEKTLLNASSVKSEDSKKKKTEVSFDLGKKIAQDAIKKNIKEAVFDRGGFPYIGCVSRVAEGAREGGLKI